MKITSSPRELNKIQVVASLLEFDHESVTSIPAGYPFSIQELIDAEKGIQGEIIYPWSSDYSDAKHSENPLFDAKPTMVVFVANYSDIRCCLKLATDKNLATTIRSGRHSIANYSVCDGLVIDVSKFQGIYVDRKPIIEDSTVWVQAGVTFEDLNPQLEFYGMHLPGGGCPTVSVAGYMQGGGYSLTSRTYGIQSDLVVEFSMMLADGKIVVASKDQNEDLFWAVRGGTGGNFGILLDMKYKIFELGKIWGFALEWDFEEDFKDAGEALYLIQEHYLKGNQHPELGIQTMVYTDFGSVLTEGRKKVRFGASYVGTREELFATIDPLLKSKGVVISVNPWQGLYSEVNNDIIEGIPNFGEATLSYLPPAYNGPVYYGRSTYVSKSLTATDYEDILEFFKKNSANNLTMIDFEAYGGVINEFDLKDSSFIHRDTIFDFYVLAFFNASDKKKNRQFIKDMYEFMEKFSNGHSYQNYPNRDQEDWQWAYWGTYYYQLRKVKEKYDTKNFFNYGQTIGADLKDEFADKQEFIFESNSPIIHENY
ncbi:MAG: FAD/FMN-containing dehydrogenase [Arenicella sp.]|jgi:FAD/FMN-containing dehydrogenase